MIEKKTIKEIVEIEKPKSILVVTANKSYLRSGSKYFIESEITDFHHIDGFGANPTIEELKILIKKINETKADLIIGIGGGSILDISKAAAVLYDKESPEDYIKGKVLETKGIKTLLIPTTSGTGSEATPFSIIIVDKIKTPFANPSMYADYIILNPELTYSMDEELTAETGIDALSHAIESYWSVSSTEESIGYSAKAIELILRNIEQACTMPTPDSRQAMLQASYLAGKAIAIAKTTAAHAVSYPITSFFNIPHGRAVALTLGHFIEINGTQKVRENLDIEAYNQKFNNLLSLLNVKTPEEGKLFFEELQKKIGLPVKFSEFNKSEYKVTEKDIPKIVDNGMSPSRMINNPVEITKEIMTKILVKIIR